MSLISRLTPSQRASLQREYDQIRMRDLDEQDRRRAWAKEQCPQLFEIRSQIAAISSQAARDRILNKTQEGPDYSERIGELVERQQMYLDNLDVPRDFLDPVFECPKCHDTGFLPDGQPCSCYISKAVRLVYGSMNNRNLDPDASFASFSLDWYSTEPGPDGQSPRTKAETVLKQAKDFAARIGAGHGYANMLLYGNPGTGKTFLTNCIVSELLQSNINVIYFSAVDLFEALSYTSRQKQNAESVQDAAFVTECDLLVIDDLGTEMANAFTRSILFDVINTRLNLHKSTLISTNLPPSGLRTLYTERISSRIMGNYHVWQLTGEDIRILKLKKADVGEMLDAGAPGVFAGIGIAVWGDFFNRTHYGPLVQKAAHKWFPLATFGDDLKIHYAAFFYEFLLCLVLIVLYYALLRKRMQRKGDRFLLMALLYCLGRFGIDSIRQGLAMVGPLAFDQICEMALFLLCLCLLLFRPKGKEQAAAEPQTPPEASVAESEAPASDEQAREAEEPEEPAAPETEEARTGLD